MSAVLPGSRFESSGARHTTEMGPCHLLKLPAELRNRIYEFALIEDHAIQMVQWEVHAECLRSVAPGAIVQFPYGADFHTQPCFACKQYRTFPAQEPALRRTSWQIRNEALPVFYSGNAFRSLTHGRFQSHWQIWLRHLGQRKVSMVRRLEIGAPFRCIAFLDLDAHTLVDYKARVMNRAALEEGLILRPETVYVETAIAETDYDGQVPATIWTNNPFRDAAEVGQG